MGLGVLRRAPLPCPPRLTPPRHIPSRITSLPKAVRQLAEQMIGHLLVLDDASYTGWRTPTIRLRTVQLSAAANRLGTTP